MITVEHLTKYYGDFLAVEDLSFQIDEGSVYGFLGPNGAGKSTTMNIMTGCLSPSEGTVKICGYDILEEPDKAKRCIGYLPEQPPLYLSESPEEYLRFVGEAKGLHGAALRVSIAEAMERTGITHVRQRRISELSKGYKQRVGIAQALLGDPKVIILDEPTVGLDPIQIIEIRDLIRDLGKTHTVILSSHILSEVQSICSRILIISKGKLAAFDTPENLEAQFSGTGELKFTAQGTPEEVEDILAHIEHATAYSTSPDGEYTRVTLQTDSADTRAIGAELFFAFAAKGKAIVELSARRATLEDIFLELTEKSGDEEQPEEGGEPSEDDAGQPEALPEETEEAPEEASAESAQETPDEEEAQ